MTPKTWLWLLIIICAALCTVYEVAANEPVFLSWLADNDPGDQTIRDYWERHERGELSSDEMIDLGTMLFYRGYPRDAIAMYKASLKVDKKQYEPWFRIGLVEHQQGNHRQARTAYKKSLDLFKGQGWCNFYLGLLEEREGNSQKAMKYYQKAFKYAPELADAEVNPEMEASELSLGAWLLMTRQRAFQQSMPMSFMEPDTVQKVRSGYHHTPTPIPDAEAPGTSQATEQGRTEVKGELKPAEASGGVPAPVVVPEKSGGSTVKPTESRSSRSKRRSVPPKPTPAPRPVTDDDLPYGLPMNRSVSPEAYPGF
jgi:tetratricopeptide (TPR) repeat protein